jgi:hypothetical protein
MLDAEQLNNVSTSFAMQIYAILPKAARIEVMLGCSAMLETLTLTQEIYFTALPSQTFSSETSDAQRLGSVETKGEETGFRFFLSQELKANGNKIAYRHHRCLLCSEKERRSG